MASSSNIQLTATLLAKLEAKGINIEELLASSDQIPDPTPADVATELAPVEQTVAQSQNSRSGETQSVTQQSKKRKTVLARSHGSTRKSARLNKGKAVKETQVETIDIEENEAVDLAGMDERVIIPPMVVDVEYLSSHSLGQIVECFDTQGWLALLTGTPKVDLALVREFYRSFTVSDVDGVLFGKFKIGDEQCAFTSQNLAKWLQVPHIGYGDYSKGRWPAEFSPRTVVDLVSETSELPVGNGSISSMGIVHRMMHKLLCSNILPRLQKKAVIFIQDYLVLYHLLTRQPINLPRQIMQHMEHARSSNKHSLPYPGIIKIILERCYVYEPKEETDMWEQLGEGNFERMGWVYTEGVGWQRKSAVPSGGDTPRKQSTRGKDTTIDLAPVLAEIQSLKTLLSAQPLNAFFEVPAGLTAKLEEISVMVTDIKDTVDHMLVKQDVLKDSVEEIKKQLRYVGTNLLDELKVYFATRP